MWNHGAIAIVNGLAFSTKGQLAAQMPWVVERLAQVRKDGIIDDMAQSRDVSHIFLHVCLRRILLRCIAAFLGCIERVDRDDDGVLDEGGSGSTSS